MKKENLVLTISIGDYYNEIATHTLPTIKNYAKKIGADFLNINEHNPQYITQKWNKFHIHELLNQYKRILYLDVDVLVREDCPNLFDIVPENKLGMFNEGRYAPRFEFLEQASEYYGEPIREWKGKFYNSGVMVISRIHKQLFKLPKGIDFVETDQPYLNLRIVNDKIDMFDLDYKFNRMDILDKYCGISRLDSYIVHYAGAPKEMIFDVMNKDIQQWKNDRPNYEYKQNILISVTAGMGDQLCSEPAIRFTQKIYPDANIFVVTHFPRLFEHLNLPVMKYEEWNGINDSVITMYTCPDDEQSEHKLSHVLFHPTDYASMSMIKRAIPNADKTIKLKLDADDVASVIDLLKNKKKEKPTILVHAGRWWPSKTLPQEWWQEIVNRLSKKLTVVLIGKTIDEEQGYLNVNCPEDGVDLRDLTSLGELIALISLSKCLLTNDSSPLHIAGAFDNWIVTIPTCKHPDHILPFRNGTQYHKAKALYKNLLIDDLEIRHTVFKADTIDIIPEGKTLYDYIPDVDTVVDEIFKIYEMVDEKKLILENEQA
jgi:lipopolysaccharide biosynthesis glycosyltransferase